MYKAHVTYTDFDGNERREDLYFHIRKSKLIELALHTPGGLQRKIEAIYKADDYASMVDVFINLMRMSYGVKSDDGKRFIQKKNGVPLFDEFQETEAYEAYFDKLLDDPDEASRLINGIIPADMVPSDEQIEAERKRLEAEKNNSED